MSANSRCSFCLELPAMPHAKAGSANLNRCPVCKGELIRVHGVTYRADDSVRTRSRLGPIVAALALIVLAGGVAALAWPRSEEPVPVAVVTKPVSAPVTPISEPEPIIPKAAPQAQPAPQPPQESRTVIHVDVVAGTKRNAPARIKSPETATPAPSPMQSAPAESAIAEATPARSAPKANSGPSRWTRPWTEHELKQMLYDVPEVAMDTRLLGRIPNPTVPVQVSSGSTATIRRRATTSSNPDIEAVWSKLRERTAEQKDKLIEALVKEQPALAQLPMLKGDACKLSEEQAKILDQSSRALRDSVRLPHGLRHRPFSTSSKAADAFDQIYGGQVPAERAKSIGYLLQGFQAAYLNHANYSRTQPTDPPNTMDAAKRLVKRALFDPAKEVRLAAIDRLKDYRDVGATPLLMEGLNHPWAPINYNAAEALVALRPANVVPALQQMLHAPNPAAPFEKVVEGKRTLVVPEMVRINHHGNCLLCHAPSTSDKDLVRGLVPHPSERMREVYYQSREPDAVFVRADITYLRQEFSELLNVDDHGEWPSEQRFDFLVRHRPLTDAEAAEWKARKHRTEATPPPPARRAVMYAIEQLSQ